MVTVTSGEAPVACCSHTEVVERFVFHRLDEWCTALIQQHCYRLICEHRRLSACRLASAVIYEGGALILACLSWYDQLLPSPLIGWVC